MNTNMIYGKNVLLRSYIWHERSTDNDLHAWNRISSTLWIFAEIGCNYYRECVPFGVYFSFVEKEEIGTVKPFESDGNNLLCLNSVI